ncbi:MAG: hypothetical protein SFX73_15610, partial [Kofleriaceae bacterium]|nr:hypothetical protein [Kofleriaceae bacterium]
SPRTAEDAATPGANARFERVAAATVMLWNATLADTSDAAREHVVASLAAEGPWDRAALDRLVARRLRLFADDLRRVEHHEVRWSGGEPGLGVTFSHPIK